MKATSAKSRKNNSDAETSSEARHDDSLLVLLSSQNFFGISVYDLEFMFKSPALWTEFFTLEIIS